jgi:hypothetical protein
MFNWLPRGWNLSLALRIESRGRNEKRLLPRDWNLAAAAFKYKLAVAFKYKLAAAFKYKLLPS